MRKTSLYPICSATTANMILMARNSRQDVLLEILIRGIDGLTTAQDGLLQLIQQYRHLSLKFTITQRRCTIGLRLQLLLEPWFAFPPPAVDAAMRTLVFPTFTTQEYLAAVALPFPLPQERGSFFVRDLLLLWHSIGRARATAMLHGTTIKGARLFELVIR
jgi:hypothetical protein